MRITTGIYKGKSIGSPKGIRPTQDKVRKALFDILGDIEGLTFLELFAGSGAVGIEALSRGAKEVVFVESNPACFKALRENLHKLQLTAPATKRGGPAKFFGGYSLKLGDALKVIKDLAQNKLRFDIIFLDPPYYLGPVPRRPQSATGLRAAAGLATTVRRESLAKKTLQTLSACDILAGNGFIIAQHFKKDDLPDGLGVFSLFRQARYGDTVLSFYRKG